MDAGRLDRVVLLSHRSLTVNSAGEHVSSWPFPYARVWAEVADVSSRELIAGGGMTGDRVTQFRIRWRSDILMTDQVEIDGLHYNISHIAEIGRHEGLELLGTAAVQ